MLIKCPECNHDVSDKAKFCPQCGYPISETNINVVNHVTNEVCPICNTKEHVLTNGNDVCKECGYIFKQNVISKPAGNKEVELSTEECPICKSRTHLLEDDNDVCGECGYIYRRNVSSPVKKVKNKVICKYCGSTNVQKLGYWSGGWKAAYAGLQWHCNNCNSDF